MEGSTSKYSLYDRERAVAAWVERGTYTGASELTGIPWETIRDWRKNYSEWWDTSSEAVRALYEDEHRANLREIITRSSAALLERLDMGDQIFDSKSGELKRIKVKARDIAVIMGVSVDKLRLSLGQATSLAGKAAQSTVDKLEALKQHARDEAIADGSVTELHQEQASQSGRAKVA